MDIQAGFTDNKDAHYICMNFQEKSSMFDISIMGKESYLIPGMSYVDKDAMQHNTTDLTRRILMLQMPLPTENMIHFLFQHFSKFGNLPRSGGTSGYM